MRCKILIINILVRIVKYKNVNLLIFINVKLEGINKYFKI